MDTRRFAHVRWSRKPSAWAEIYTTVRIGTLPEGLPRYAAADLGIRRSPLAGFTNPPDGQYFLVDVGDDLYLANTEGYDYAKYWVAVTP
jgi:hypothetical protein